MHLYFFPKGPKGPFVMLTIFCSLCDYELLTRQNQKTMIVYSVKLFISVIKTIYPNISARQRYVSLVLSKTIKTKNIFKMWITEMYIFFLSFVFNVTYFEFISMKEIRYACVVFMVYPNCCTSCVITILSVYCL